MIIGADVGTQSLKVAVLDDRMRTVGRAGRCYQPSYLKPGWVEQAPSLWTDALDPAIAEAQQAARVSPGDIRAIGFSGQLDGCIAVTQMRADIVQRPVELPNCIDCAPIGAALLAAVAGGVARDLKEAVGALDDGHTDIAPDRTQADAYDAAHDRCRQLFGALRPLFSEQPRN